MPFHKIWGKYEKLDTQNFHILFPISDTALSKGFVHSYSQHLKTSFWHVLATKAYFPAKPRRRINLFLQELSVEYPHVFWLFGTPPWSWGSGGPSTLFWTNQVFAIIASTPLHESWDRILTVHVYVTFDWKSRKSHLNALCNSNHIQLVVKIVHQWWWCWSQVVRIAQRPRPYTFFTTGENSKTHFNVSYPLAIFTTWWNKKNTTW